MGTVPVFRGFIMLVIVLGISAGACGLFTGQFGAPPGTRPEYADSNGDGFVPAQGDPLWDQHYAGEVNVPNSQALENLGQAEEYKAAAELQSAEAKRVQAETLMTYMLVGALVVIFLFVVGFVTVGMVKGAQ